MTDQIVGGLLTVVSALVVAAIFAVVRRVRQRQQAEEDQAEQLLRVIHAVVGIKPSPDGTILGQPSLIDQVTELRTRQEQIASRAVQAADDAAVVKEELTHNGGDSTKDIVQQAMLAAKATERLMRRHMENGAEIMEVGEHNDGIIVAAIESLGGVVEPLKPYPAVDIGSDDE